MHVPNAPAGGHPPAADPPSTPREKRFGCLQATLAGLAGLAGAYLDWVSVTKALIALSCDGDIEPGPAFGLNVMMLARFPFFVLGCVAVAAAMSRLPLPRAVRLPLTAVVIVALLYAALQLDLQLLADPDDFPVC